MRILSFLRSLKHSPSLGVSRRAPHGNRIVLRLETLEDRCVPSIVSENALPGTPPSVWDTDHNDDPSIQGYAVGFSANHGQWITFRVNVTLNPGQTTVPYSLQIYRFGYYQGNGARLVDNDIPLQHEQPQPNPITDVTTGLVDAGNWRDSFSWHVPGNATSGVYFARITRTDGTLGYDNRPAANFMIFVVRDDQSHSDMLVKTSDATWQAYNYFGGASFYFADPSIFPAPNLPYGRGYQVSYNRPFTNVFNGGYPYSKPEDFNVNVVNNTFIHAEWAFVAWAESQGYDISYVSDLDLQRTPSLAQGHKILVSSGHDEYWSENERDGVEAARAAGVNMSYQDGNEVYWRTQYYPGIGGSASDPRTLSCYKESYNPNLYNAARGFTGLWDDEVNYHLPNRPTNALTGQDWTGQYNTPAPITVPYPDSTDRFWRSTTIASQRPTDPPAVMPGIVGFEFDEPRDNGLQPAGLILMSHTVYNGFVDFSTHPVPINFNLTLYRDTTGHGLVFAAGSIIFNWALDSVHHDAMGYGFTDADLNYNPPSDVRMQQAMVNLYADMGNVQPHSLRTGLVAATPSTDHTPPTSRITSPANNAQVVAGSTVTIQGSASDSGGGNVGGVEVSVDGGTTWHPASGTSNWTYSWTVPTTLGSVRIRTRATDDSCNIETPGSGITVQVVQSTQTGQGPSQPPPGSGDPTPGTTTAPVEGSLPAVRGSAVRLLLSSQPAAGGNGVIITVTAVDVFGNTVSGYRGAVSLSSDDPRTADLGSHTFTTDDHGVFSFHVPAFAQRHTRVTATSDNQLTGFVDVLND